MQNIYTATTANNNNNGFYVQLKLSFFLETVLNKEVLFRDPFEKSLTNFFD